MTCHSAKTRLCETEECARAYLTRSRKWEQVLRRTHLFRAMYRCYQRCHDGDINSLWKWTVDTVALPYFLCCANPRRIFVLDNSSQDEKFDSRRPSRLWQQLDDRLESRRPTVLRARPLTRRLRRETTRAESDMVTEAMDRRATAKARSAAPASYLRFFGTAVRCLID